MTADLTLADQTSAWDHQELTHMPFLCRDGRRYLLVFARSLFNERRVPQYGLFGTMRVWRLAWTRCNPKVGSWDPIQPLHTGLGRFEVECCPCVTTHLGGVHVSFIGSTYHGVGSLQHHLYRMSGPSLDKLGPAVRAVAEPCVSGFWRPDQAAVWNGKDGVIHLEGRFNYRLTTAFEQIGRISFDPENPFHLLITGILPGAALVLDGLRQSHTVVYDLEKKKVLGEVLASGSPAYKPSFCGELLASVQPGPRMRRESWKIALADRFTMGRTGIDVRPIR